MGKHFNVFIKVEVLAEDKWISTVTAMVSILTSYEGAPYLFTMNNNEAI